jgi:hypothetical protein
MCDNAVEQSLICIFRIEMSQFTSPEMVANA